MSRVIFSPLRHGHYDVLRPALKAAHLPTEDLMERDRSFFCFPTIWAR